MSDKDIAIGRVTFGPVISPLPGTGTLAVKWKTADASYQDLEQERRQFVAELAAIKHRAGQLGMWRTMQHLDRAASEAGYELADLLTGKQTDTARKE